MTRICTASRTTAVLATMAAIVGGVQLAAPDTAAAISGLERKWESYGPRDREPVKLVQAECSAGKHVVGVGAVVDDGGQNDVRLVAVYPHSYGSSYRDGATVVAEAPGLSRSYNWSVTGYAICASLSPSSNHQIVRSDLNVPSSGGPFVHTSARCPSGTVAYGAGASIGNAGPSPWGAGRLGLQLNRTSGPLDISRAAAREEAGGFSGSWWLSSFAICAKPYGGIHAEGEVAPGAEASSTCAGPTYVHGIGGGGGLTDGGPVWLRRIHPRPGLRSIDVALTGPLYSSVGGMVAHHTCAT
jgi:hypothetical protein